MIELACAQDVGKAMNPQAVEGQIHGGSAQGLGLAIMEEIQVRDGRIANPSFTDYLIPTILDMPPMRVEVLEYPDPNAPYGLRGVGEPPTISSGPGGRGGDPRGHRARPHPDPDQARAHHGPAVTAEQRRLGLDSMMAEADRLLAGRRPGPGRGLPGAAARPAAGAHGLRARRPVRPRAGRGVGPAGAATCWRPARPDPAEFGAAMGLPAGLAADVRSRVLAKLVAEPVEDLRLDFEDGYGDRGDDAEDADARRAAAHLAAEIAAGTGAAVHRPALQEPGAGHPPPGDPHAG